MEHTHQLPICAQQNKTMDQKLDALLESTSIIGENITELKENKIRQEAFNDKVLLSLDVFTKRLKEQDDFNKKLTLFAFLGDNWKWLVMAFFTGYSAWLAYQTLIVQTIQK